MDISNSKKQELRKRFRAERSLRDLSETWTHIINSQEFSAAKTIASYISYGDEPQTKDLNLAILKSGKNLLLPRMLKDKSLEWIAWNGDAALIAAFSRSGAFPLQATSGDAAILATLPPGAYTAQVVGANSTTGIALVEVYNVPAN